MKRLSVFFTACLVLLVCIAVPGTLKAYTDSNTVSIQHEGKTIEELTVTTDEISTLTAVAPELDVDSWQWQLLVDAQSDKWVDVYDKTDTECEFSYAMIKNMLDDSNSAYIRCEATCGDKEIYSSPVCITVVPTKAAESGFTDESMERYLIKDGTASDAPAAASLAAEPLAAANNDSDEYVTITIKYLDWKTWEENKIEAPLYSSYVAVLEKGTSFKKDVISPAFLGFAPYYDADPDDSDKTVDDSAAIISFDISELTGDITYNVYYKAVEVNYAVKFMYQNIHDDLYTENAAFYSTGTALTGTIITDAMINEHLAEKDTSDISGTGFQKLYHWPEAVAADGSTVFECYYDRNYYLVQFDMDGGYGVEPIFARYGTPFLVNDPIKPGYTFAGWELIKVDTDNNGEWEDVPAGTDTTLINEIPAYDCYYKAKWTPNTNTAVTVVYWLEDSNYVDPTDGSTVNKEEKYNYWASKNITAQSGTTINGEDYKSIEGLPGLDEYDVKYSEFAEADNSVEVKGSGSTIVNVYYDRKEYTLKFYYASEENGVYKVVGGSTYHFGTLGASANDAGDEVSLLDYTAEKSNWGTITAAPELNSTGAGRNYKTGKTQSNSNSSRYYYYISFTVKYGQDITDLWPCDVFKPVTRTTANTHVNWSQKTAYVSAWNGEHHVYYSQINRDNQTVKGNYEKLDYQLLFHSNFEDSDTVSYLCFWENGADVGWSVPSLWIYNIWVPVLNGHTVTGTEGVDYRVKNGITYKLEARYFTCDDSDLAHQTQPALEGYSVGANRDGGVNNDEQTRAIIEATGINTDGYKNKYCANFYYTRDDNPLRFYSHNKYVAKDATTIAVNGIDVPYETALTKDDFFFVPEYPDNLEENAYIFDGWYTSPECVPGTEFYSADGSYYGSTTAPTMPGKALTLYAKWTPIKHTVNFFNNYNEMLAYEAGTSVNMHRSFSDIVHGNLIGKEVGSPEQTDTSSGLTLTFAGWFYMENGEKKAFTPLDMPINRNMNIFADWSSQSPQPYRVSYVEYGDASKKVADDTYGYAYGGTTRTFAAKAGDPYNQLYERYNTGWFPTVSSHSITIAAEKDEKNPVNNVFSFEYVNVPDVSYTVRYLDKTTGLPVAAEKKVTTNNAVVTERFAIVQDMVPDAFYKNLTLSVEYKDNEWVSSESNIITFYYTANKQSAYYAVHHMMETVASAQSGEAPECTIDSEDFDEITRTEGTGDVGEVVSVSPLNRSGFDVIGNSGLLYVGKTSTNTPEPTRAELNSSGKYDLKVTKEGTELYIFYERKSYPYVVNYYEYNTTRILHESTAGTRPYEDEITVTAPSIDGYTCVSNTTQTMSIREETVEGSVTKNVMTFYYSPTQYTVEYKAVTSDGGRSTGLLSNTIEVKKGAELFDGSTPVSNSYYAFDGWYLDEACTQPAAMSNKVEIDEATNKLTPAKAELSDTESNIFYAKFTRRCGGLTIYRTTVSDVPQTFVYEVKNNVTGEIILVTAECRGEGIGTVTIKDLPYGQYTITQQNDWSWRFADNAQHLDHKLTYNASGQPITGSQLSFGMAVPDDAAKTAWLNGSSLLIKNKWGEQR